MLSRELTLIGRYVGERLRPLPPLEDDPLWEIIGMVKGRPGDSARVDDVVDGPGFRHPALAKIPEVLDDNVHEILWIAATA